MCKNKNWKFAIRMTGANGEVEMSQFTDNISNGPEIRQKMIDEAVKVYKSMEPKP